MRSLNNQVQLIGNIGDTPKVATLKSGTKVVSFPLATNESYRNNAGEKVQDTQWHQIVAWGKTAEIIEKYAYKGAKLAIKGKLKSRSFTAKDGNARHVTEVHADEVLLMDPPPTNAKAKKTKA